MNSSQDNPPVFRPETKLAIKAAKAAGEKILEIYATDFETEYKQDREPFTLADTASEEIILRNLSSLGYPVLSEESYQALDKDRQDKFWIVDPLDGTADFIEKTDEFSVMIALVENSQPIVGAIYQPSENKLYVAEVGHGAFLYHQNQWQKLRVSEVTNLLDSSAVMSRHHLSAEEVSVIEKLGIKNYVRFGSAGLKAGAVAEGKADFYFTLTNKIKIWDTAAAEILVKESGGKVSDIHGTVLVYGSPEIRHLQGVLMSNGKLHQEIIKKI